MPVETPSFFAQVIQDHLELKRQNSTLESDMPIERYKNEDPMGNHPLFKSEEQARLDRVQLAIEPRPAGGDLGPVRLLVDAALPQRLPLEVLDDVRDVGLLPVDARVRHGLVEDAPGRPDERTALLVLLVPGLL